MWTSLSVAHTTSTVVQLCTCTCIGHVLHLAHNSYISSFDPAACRLAHKLRSLCIVWNFLHSVIIHITVSSCLDWVFLRTCTMLYQHWFLVKHKLQIVTLWSLLWLYSSCSIRILSYKHLCICMYLYAPLAVHTVAIISQLWTCAYLTFQ